MSLQALSPTLSIAFFLVGLSTPAAASPQAAPPVRNARQAYLSPFDVEGNVAGRAFYVREEDQGGTDLNGDGDTVDTVLRVVPAGLGPVAGPALAVEAFESLQMVGDLVVFAVEESGQGGVDLNGDGDAVDQVVHLYDATTGQVTNLMRVKVHGGLRLTATSLFLHVSELSEGADLNGDGDQSDYVLEHVDLASGMAQTFPLALDIGVQLVPQLIDGDVAVVLADEADQGQDLDGNGKTDGVVPFVAEARAGTLTGLGYSLGIGTVYAMPVTSDGRVAFLLPEAVGGADLNGDGDSNDGVVQLLVPSSGVQINTTLAVTSPTLIRLGGDVLALGVSEAKQGGRDLNGDGDTDDAVLHLLDATTGVVVGSGPALAQLVDLERGLVAFAADESGEGMSDLNGDGDAQDQVLHLLDRTGGPAVNLGLAMRQLPLNQVRLTSGRMTAFLVSEADQGGADLNADGDADDEVWFVHDRRFGVTTNLRLAWSAQAAQPYVHAGEDFVLLAALELATGGRDLNGDGDTDDRVLALYSAGAAVPVPLGAALSGSYWGFGNLDGRRLVIGLSEAANGGDLNGDGDTLDRVAHVVDLP
jgi:hypothetical protein